jgi:RNA polymerase sigma factor (sigma-70 family)
MAELIHQLRRTVLLRDGAGLTDGQLLEAYITRHDQAALAALVQRHGPMVWGVCRRVLGNYHDAEDAFQATFLVLVRKATSVRPREMVANWLYGVAHQTALKAKATVSNRKGRERQVVIMPETAVAEPAQWDELLPVLDEELSRLPNKYRAVVLCDLEGKTRKEAARQLGVPEGTVAGWVARARVMLANRLTERGITLSGGMLATILAQNVMSAGVPPLVVSNTIKVASLTAAGQVTAGVVSVKVAALTEGVLKAMFVSKLKIVLAVVLILGLVGFGGGSSLIFSGGATAQEPSKPTAEVPQFPKAPRAVPKNIGNPDYEELVGVVIGVLDDKRFGMKLYEKRMATLFNNGVPTTGVHLDDISVSKETKVFIDGREGKLADLQKSMRVAVELKPNTNSAVLVRASWPKLRGEIAFMDAKKLTLVARKTRVLPTEKQTGIRLETAFLDKEVTVLIDGKEGKLADLKKGMPAVLYLRADTEGVIRIEAKKSDDK